MNGISHVLKDDKGSSFTYEDLRDFCIGFADTFNLKGRELVFVLCENTVTCAAFICACLKNKTVPLLLNGHVDKRMLERYISIYRPNYLYGPEGLVRINERAALLHEELSILLPTSGTTGSPKLARHSYRNLDISVKSVAKAFEINKNDYAVLGLPIHFTQGLSVLLSHLHAGGRVFLTDEPLNSRSFWNIMKDEEITSFSGVPYSYEVLDRLRFYTMKLPSLNVLSQGGGRMSDKLFSKLASYAADTGKKFFATYGSTETTARMSCLRPEYAAEKTGSIGKPLDGYEMWLVDENGSKIQGHGITGELVFKGGSVTMGYAEEARDLEKGDEWGGVYNTGDLAYRDKDGFYYITGRLSRFIKIFGHRVNLDEAERLVKAEFDGDFACTGKDDKLYLFTNNKDADIKKYELFLKDKLKINVSAFEAAYVEKIPKKQNGKIDYIELMKGD